MTNKVVLSLKATRAIWYFYVLFCFVLVFFFFFYIRSFLYRPVFTFRLKWSIFVSMAGSRPVWPVFFPVRNKGVFVLVYWLVRYIPAVSTGTVRNWLPWLRALVAMELKNYITILAPPKHKNNHTAIELNLFFFSFIATVHIYL